MITRFTLAVCAATAMFATASSAATLMFAETARSEVAGTTTVAKVGGELELGTVATGDSAQVFGRVGTGSDQYNFELTGAGSFNLGFLFGGYDLAAGGSTATSGLIAKTPPRQVSFSLEPVGGSETQTLVSADITSGTSVLFGNLSAGEYILRVDGLGISGNGTTYDLQIAAVPLPATALLLLAGVAGLGFAGRRRKG